MKTEDLISQLSTDLKPVNRLETPFVFAAKWSLVSLVVVGLALVVTRPRADLLETLRGTDTVFEILSFLTVLYSALMLVSWRSSPGRERGGMFARWFFLMLAVAALINGVRVFGMSSELMAEGAELAGSGCAVVAMVVGLVMGSLIAWQARRGASVRPLFSGVVVGLAALGAGGVAITLHCGSQNGMHILLWHFLTPLVVMILFGLVLGKKVLRW